MGNERCGSLACPYQELNPSRWQVTCGGKPGARCRRLPLNPHTSPVEGTRLPAAKRDSKPRIGSASYTARRS